MPIINNKYFHGPSLHTDFKSPNNSVPSLLWSEFVIVRVCYGLSCPVTRGIAGAKQKKLTAVVLAKIVLAER